MYIYIYIQNTLMKCNLVAFSKKCEVSQKRHLLNAN